MLNELLHDLITDEGNESADECLRFIVEINLETSAGVTGKKEVSTVSD
jgi:hypothetical protein